MTFAGPNYLAIVVAAVAAFFFGGIYYQLLAAHWMKAAGLSKKNIQNASHAPLLVAFVAELIMVWMLAGVLGHLGPGQVTVKNGAISGAFLWFGFVATTLVVNNAFGQRKLALSAIDAVHWLAVLLIMGAIIGAFGV
jgi:hypothetical protein